MEAIERKLMFLYAAIQDTQETIKFTDTKSGAIILLICVKKNPHCLMEDLKKFMGKKGKVLDPEKKIFPATASENWEKNTQKKKKKKKKKGGFHVGQKLKKNSDDKTS
jgi:hypothetical protein